MGVSGPNMADSDRSSAICLDHEQILAWQRQLPLQGAMPSTVADAAHANHVTIQLQTLQQASARKAVVAELTAALSGTTDSKIEPDIKRMRELGDTQAKMEVSPPPLSPARPASASGLQDTPLTTAMPATSRPRSRVEGCKIKKFTYHEYKYPPEKRGAGSTKVKKTSNLKVTSGGASRASTSAEYLSQQERQLQNQQYQNRLAQQAQYLQLQMYADQKNRGGDGFPNLDGLDLDKLCASPFTDLSESDVSSVISNALSHPGGGHSELEFPSSTSSAFPMDVAMASEAGHAGSNIRDAMTLEFSRHMSASNGLLETSHTSIFQSQPHLREGFQLDRLRGNSVSQQHSFQAAPHLVQQRLFTPQSHPAADGGGTPTQHHLLHLEPKEQAPPQKVQTYFPLQFPHAGQRSTSAGSGVSGHGRAYSWGGASSVTNLSPLAPYSSHGDNLSPLATYSYNGGFPFEFPGSVATGGRAPVPDRPDTFPTTGPLGALGQGTTGPLGALRQETGPLGALGQETTSSNTNFNFEFIDGKWRA